MYRINILPTALKELKKIVSKRQLLIRIRIRNLSKDAYPSGIKKLKSKKGLFRIRSGNFRIIFSINELDKVVTIIAIKDRKNAY